MLKIRFILLIAIGTLGLSLDAMSQCSCEPRLSIEDHFKKADIVFAGKVVSTKLLENDGLPGPVLIVEFEVMNVWKVQTRKRITVQELRGSLEGFEQDSKWLVYASKTPDERLQLFRGCCSRTKPLSVAKAQGDIKAFGRMGAKEMKIID